MEALRLLIYRLWYGIKFESGYEYCKIQSYSLDSLEIHHTIMLSDGWERISDVEANFNVATCWYRKKL